jgi:hypothetical protein
MPLWGPQKAGVQNVPRHGKNSVQRHKIPDSKAGKQRRSGGIAVVALELLGYPEYA